ncbi:MAG: hypothetical protein INQ03_12440 [Candidatus Heimdallarchaeota archaeon]|nr:hypothetical protein [Candidatus Heimdallarchaeota archaeon]
MLTELYVIVEGTTQYYYSKAGRNTGGINVNLTSGFLTAIQAFTKEARQSDIEYFASQEEYFLFTQLEKSNKLLIGVYEKGSNRETADNILHQVKNIIESSHLMDEKYRYREDLIKNQLISDKIDTIIRRMFEDDYPTLLADTIFNSHSSLSLIRIMNIETDIIFWEKARPKPLLKKKQIEEMNLLIATADKLGEKLKQPKFELLHIEVNNAQIGLLRNNNILAMTFASGIMSNEEFMLATFGLFDITSPHYLSYNRDSIVGSIELDNDGSIINRDGDLKTPMIEIFISSLLNAMERFTGTFIRKSFHSASLYYPSTENVWIKIKKTEKDGALIEILGN